MVDVARVKLYGATVGAIQWDSRYEIGRFEYDKTFINSGLQPSPLLMPTVLGKVYTFANINRDTFHGLPGMLADCLPDTYGRALFNKWLSLTGRTSANPVETLCYFGNRCMGALEFEPAIVSTVSENQKFDLDSLIEVAKEAISEKSKFETNISKNTKNAVSEIVRLGTSAGGQRAKAIIAYNKQTGEIRSGQIPAPDGFEHYLIKLDGVSAETGFKQTENFGRLEYSFYLLAKKCGINMMDSELIEENGRAHFLTKRFDRKNGDKIHTQTLCGIAHYDFKQLRAYSYEQNFNVMRTLRLPYPDAVEMFRRMVFNVIVRNQDDHTKNISFLMDRNGVWRLSPAYDMGYSYNPNGGWTAMHQMSINGKYDKILRSDLLACAEKNHIKSAGSIIDEILEVANSWQLIAKECGVPNNFITSILPNMLLSL